jgi:outer membrane biosynthesis protein TonB
LTEKLFDIARRVPFLAMTILEKNSMDSPWLFRTQPLQAGTTPSVHEVPPEPTQPPPPTFHHPVVQQKPQAAAIQMTPAQPQQEQHLQQNQNLRPRVPTGPIPIDPKKVVKSSTAPNLPTSNSLSEMFRVI